MLQLILVSLVSLSAMAEDHSVYDNYESRENYDSNPVRCAQIRREANKTCRGDNDCYTSEVSRLVDLYNYNQERDGKDPVYLYCTY